MSDVTEIAEFETERSKVESWRLHVLIEAGYPLMLAERLAASEADLHVAVELEQDVRRRLEELAADAEAERAVLEARVQDLLRRVDAAALQQS